MRQDGTIVFLLLLAIIVGVAGYFILTNPEAGRDDLAGSTSSTQDGITLINASTTGDGAVHDVLSEAGEPSGPNEKSFLYIGKKMPGTALTVDLATLKKDGFIVVYENTFEPTGETIGISMFLPAGEYTNVPILLSRYVEDREEFTVMIHKDNGDREFSMADDTPLRDEKGNAAYATAIIENLPIE